MDPIEVNAMLCIGIYALVVIILVWSWAQILYKSGNSTWHSLWMIIPGINVIAFMIFAFGEWPILKTNTRLRRRIRALEKQEHTMVCDDCENPIAEQDKFCSACGAEF